MSCRMRHAFSGNLARQANGKLFNTERRGLQDVCTYVICVRVYSRLLYFAADVHMYSLSRYHVINDHAVIWSSQDLVSRYLNV